MTQVDTHLDDVSVADGFVCYPDYTRGERIADGIVHLLGILFSTMGFSYAFYSLPMDTPTSVTVALGVYAFTVIALFTASACYHMTPWPDARPILRLFDLSAIFCKIAGTYTALVFLIDTPLSYVLLAMIWAAAILGSASKFMRGEMLDNYTVFIYLAMGWASVFLLWPMFENLPFVSAILVVAGGLIYSFGVIFHRWENLKFQNSIWHTHVLVASVCHFFAISGAIGLL